MSIRAASPRPPFRSAMICLALASCSGGGSTPATAPVIQNLVVTPAAVYVSPTPMTFTAQFQFEDPNGDLASAELVLRDDTGGVVATQTTPIQQAAGVTAAQLIGSATATLVTPGSFTAHLSLTDRTGLVSNELTAGVEVRLFPWSTEASLPVAVRRPAAAVLGDLVYAIGGERTDLTSVGPASGAANVYDPALRTWTALPPLPTRRLAHNLVASGGRLYAIGGATTPVDLPIGTVTNVVEEFDPATQSWRTRAPMPTARALAVAAELGGRIVVAGGDADSGYDSFQPIATVESYDPVTDTWATLPPLPRARAKVHAAVFQGKLLVGGNQLQRTGDTDEIDVYDPIANAWAVLPYPRSATSAFVADDDSLWTLADAGLYRTDDPFSVQWHELTAPTSLHNGGVGPFVRVGRRLLQIGEFATVRYEMDHDIR